VDLSALPRLASGEIPHWAVRVLGVVGPGTVRAREGVGTYCVSFLPFLLINVGRDALFAVDVVRILVVSASALTAPYWAVGVLLVAVPPAAVAPDQVDLLGPSGEVARNAEVDQRVSDESLEERLVGIGDCEGDIGRFVVGVGTVPGRPVRFLHEDGVCEERVGLADGVGDFVLGDLDEAAVCVGV